MKKGGGDGSGGDGGRTVGLEPTGRGKWEKEQDEVMNVNKKWRWRTGDG